MKDRSIATIHCHVTAASLGRLGSQVISRGRAAGLEQVDKFVTEALLNPSLAKSLLAKVPPRPEIGTAASLGSRSLASLPRRRMGPTVRAAGDAVPDRRLCSAAAQARTGPAEEKL